jgi:hypothetical protein
MISSETRTLSTNCRLVDTNSSIIILKNYSQSLGDCSIVMILSLSPSSVSRILSSLCHTRTMSTVPPPYRFHVCANWLSAPPGHGPKRRSVPFSPDSALGIWRDSSLSWPRPGLSRTPGEDFFYIQEVRLCARSIFDPQKFLKSLREIIYRCETSR